MRNMPKTTYLARVSVLSAEEEDGVHYGGGWDFWMEWNEMKWNETE
jgi:hypothetical protein